MKYKLDFKYSFKNGVKINKERKKLFREQIMSYFETHKKGNFYFTGTGDTMVVGVRFKGNKNVVVFVFSKYKKYEYKKIKKEYENN